MTSCELSTIESKHNAAIIAPAGHGKTEMVVDMVAAFSGRQLILTHTNAGVAALKKRLMSRKIDPHKYAVFTIASFCMRWDHSYPLTAELDPNLSPMNRKTQGQYYAQLYSGALKLFRHVWAGCILKSSYAGIIVDEYQDCTIPQHTLVKQLNRYLPVRVLGDPLQGIFGFKDPVVDWSNLSFEIIDIKTYPWRWKNTNPYLGKYLGALRRQLSPAIEGQNCTIDVFSIPNVLEVIKPSEFDGYKLLPKLYQYKSVLYLTKWESDQLEFCKRMPGIFQQDEKQDCSTLYDFAKLFDQKNNEELALCILNFVNECATRVSYECSTYIKNLKSGVHTFSKSRKNCELGILLNAVVINCSLENILEVLYWFENQKQFKFYRLELYKEMERSIEFAISKGIKIYDAAMHIRSDVSLQRRYTNFKYLSSRTLLSKGLEFDCVIIDTQKQLTAKELYVAMTRARKMIYLITDKSTLTLKP